MRAQYSDALTCDFAQYYGLHDIFQYGVRHAAILACGLPEESRVMRQMGQTKMSMDRILLVDIDDQLKELTWLTGLQHSKKRIPKPERLLPKLMQTENKKTNEVQSFATAAEFEIARARILAEG